MVTHSLPLVLHIDGVSLPLLESVLTLARRMGQKWHGANVNAEL